MRNGLGCGLGAHRKVGAKLDAIIGYIGGVKIPPIEHDGYNYLAFKTSGVIVINQEIEIDYLLVGGGGSGSVGGWTQGGGGAGGAVFDSEIFPLGEFDVEIGAGAVGGDGGSNYGSYSSINLPAPIVAKGGGKGAAYSSGENGYPQLGSAQVGEYASGGGGNGTGVNTNTYIGGIGDGVQGKNGGSGVSSTVADPKSGGGGGGYTSAGGNGVNNIGGNGGDGILLTDALDGANHTILSVPASYCGGGGGGAGYGTSPTGGIGKNGGGNGGVRNITNATHATANTGSGGGGGAASVSGGNGADGICILRWAI
jgi:hypothetical protein